MELVSQDRSRRVLPHIVTIYLSHLYSHRRFNIYGILILAQLLATVPCAIQRIDW
jgi:hypothetical protein